MFTIKHCECLPREESGHVGDPFNEDKERKGKRKCHMLMMNHLSDVPSPCRKEKKNRNSVSLIPLTQLSSVERMVYTLSS